MQRDTRRTRDEFFNVGLQDPPYLLAHSPRKYTTISPAMRAAIIAMAADSLGATEAKVALADFGRLHFPVDTSSIILR